MQVNGHNFTDWDDSCDFVKLWRTCDKPKKELTRILEFTYESARTWLTHAIYKDEEGKIFMYEESDETWYTTSENLSDVLYQLLWLARVQSEELREEATKEVMDVINHYLLDE